MRSSILALGASAAAFTRAQAPNLATAIQLQPSLSSLFSLLGQVSNTTAFLGSQKNVTLFAPNNAALDSILSSGGIFSIGQASVDPGLIEQILRYHLFRGVVEAAEITEVPQFVHSYLNYSGFVLDGEVSGSNVTGGQVVSLSIDEEGDALVTAGIKVPSKIVATDIEFDNGVIHIIDKLLLIPLSVSETLITGNFTALAGATTQAGLVEPLESASDITIFAPNNDAFQALASSGAAANITTEQLSSILQYHVVPGVVGYSTALSNTSLPTLDGEELDITISPDGAVFVNKARVINADILIANGVIHVIDSVLTPGSRNASAPAPTTTVAAVPFTSGIEPETSVYFELTQTTSFVAAGLVTAVASSSAASGSAAATTSSSASGPGRATTSAPLQQTANAAVANGLPALAGAVVMGAVAFAL